MGGKLSPVIIVVLVLVVIAVGVLIFNVLKPSNPTNPDQGTSTGEVSTKPVLNLSKEAEGDKPSKVTITAYATTEDKDGIKEIILPDGTSVMGDVATFDVEENGEYEFKAVCVNGESDSLKIEVNEIAEISSNNPYIPEGFKEVGSSVEEGFVIEDESGNQYVWIPVESGKLTRNTMLNIEFEETNSTASALVNSVAKYYGFYIGRFEASQYEVDGQAVAASMSGKIPWTNVTYQEAIDYANKSAEAFGYTDCYTSLINSYAWDTTLAWIDTTVTNYSSVTNYGNYSGTIYPTGTTEKDVINNICDLAGNVREWTTEIYKSSSEDDSKRNDEANIISRVVRGGSANLSRTPGSHVGYKENLSDTYWGFRTILYK